MTASELLRSAMLKHDVSSANLVQRLRRDEAMSLEAAHALVGRFVSGGRCSIEVAAALVTLIADRKSA